MVTWTGRSLREYLTRNTVKFSMVIHNDHPNLILLPGLDGTGILFRPLLAILPAEIRPRVVTYPSNQRLPLAEYAELVARQLPPGDTVVLVESFSGLVALTLLARPQPRIRKVLFVASFAEPPRPLLLRLAPLCSWLGSVVRLAPAFLLKHFCLGSDADAEQLKLFREAVATVSPGVLAHRIRLVAMGASEKPIHMTVPCSYLQASDDKLVPRSAARWFQTHAESCKVESLEGPHFLLQAKPQECADWIVEELKSI